MKIENILAKKGAQVFTIHPDQLLKDAIALLVEHNIGALVVVDDAGRPVGIISERDIIREAGKTQDIFSRSVRRVMTKDVTTGAPYDDLKSVLQTMTNRHFRHLPVVEYGRLVGIVSIGDVVKAQLDEYEGEINTLQTQIIETQ